MKKICINIKGMHCQSCEILLENQLLQLDGVKKVNADHHQSQVEVFYDQAQPDQQAMAQVIKQAGYAVGREKSTGIISGNIDDYLDLAMGLLVLTGLYWLLNHWGWLNATSSLAVANPSSLSVVFLIGLTAGISTCMVLVGGLVLGISARQSANNPQTTIQHRIQSQGFFNFGRVLGYAFFGGLLGLLGSIFQLSGLALGSITILVAVVMLIMGIQLIGIFPWANKFNFTLPKALSRFLGIKETSQPGHQGVMAIGAMTFFLPCGFTQAMQLYAVSSGNFVSGAAIMGTFALGTAPGLLGIGSLTSVVKGDWSKKFFKVVGLVVILFALFNLRNGFNLIGWQWGSAAAKNQSTLNASTSAITTPATTDAIQVVQMKQLATGYSPNEFFIKKGVPVKWIIDSQAVSCASSLTVPKLKISKQLKVGENVIEFTATESGDLKFSCSMGMYTGVFHVK